MIIVIMDDNDDDQYNYDNAKRIELRKVDRMN